MISRASGKWRVPRSKLALPQVRPRKRWTTHGGPSKGHRAERSVHRTRGPHLPHERDEMARGGRGDQDDHGALALVEGRNCARRQTHGAFRSRLLLLPRHSAQADRASGRRCDKAAVRRLPTVRTTRSLVAAALKSVGVPFTREVGYLRIWGYARPGCVSDVHRVHKRRIAEVETRSARRLLALAGGRLQEGEAPPSCPGDQEAGDSIDHPQNRVIRQVRS